MSDAVFSFLQATLTSKGTSYQLHFWAQLHHVLTLEEAAQEELQLLYKQCQTLVNKAIRLVWAVLMPAWAF